MNSRHRPGATHDRGPGFAWVEEENGQGIRGGLERHAVWLYIRETVRPHLLAARDQNRLVLREDQLLEEG